MLDLDSAMGSPCISNPYVGPLGSSVESLGLHLWPHLTLIWSPALTRPVSLLLHEYSKLLLFPAYSFLHLEYSSSRYSHDSLRSLFSFPVGLSLDKQSNVAALMQPLSTFATLSSPQYLSPFNTLCIHLFNVYYLPSQECKLLKGGNWYLLSSLLYTYSACIEHALIQF